jgi:hypothetical protein
MANKSKSTSGVIGFKNGLNGANALVLTELAFERR